MNLKKIINHITNYAALYLTVVALVISAFAGGWIQSKLHHCPECPKCPEIVARSHIELDSVGPQKDTARVVKYAPSIKRTKVPPVPTVAISSADHRADSMVRFSVVDTMPDRVVIGYSLASKEFPDRYLPDMVHDAWYIAKPDRIRVTWDTLTVQLPPLQCPQRWQREIMIGGICFGVGAIAATSYFLLR
jgi:hypothetical protein